MKIRIIDIAKKAGVSPGTVDRIIHKRGKVSEKAHDKVQKAIKELGYAPDIMARNLALKKELHIVCLLPDPEETEYWLRPVAGVNRAVKEIAPFKVKVSQVYYSTRIDSFTNGCNKVIEMNADGVVYVPMFKQVSERFSSQLNKSSIPYIHVNINQPHLSPLSFVGQNPIAAGKVAASLCHLALKKGNKILIAYISKKRQEYSHLDSRIKGFTNFFADHGLNQNHIEHLKIELDKTNDNYETVFINKLKQTPDIGIVYVPNSRAYSIAALLKKHKINDIFLVGFDTLTQNLQLVKDGYINFIIGQQSKNQGYNSVIMLFNALFKKEEIKKENYLPVDILNKENIEFYEGLINEA